MHVVYMGLPKIRGPFKGGLSLELRVKVVGFRA